MVALDIPRPRHRLGVREGRRVADDDVVSAVVRRTGLEPLEAVRLDGDVVVVEFAIVERQVPFVPVEVRAGHVDGRRLRGAAETGMAK